MGPGEAGPGVERTVRCTVSIRIVVKIANLTPEREKANETCRQVIIALEMHTVQLLVSENTA
jgi:hypothetical protein